jgi:hypothetical protein
MKKHVFLLFGLMSLAFMSCEGPIGPPGDPGEGFVPYVKFFEVKSQDWQNYGSNDYVSFYKYIVDMDIGDKAYNNGFVNVYLFQIDDGNEIQTQLPYWIQYSDRGNTWLEGYNFDFDRNTVAFYADCQKGQRPPACEFRVVVAP